MKKVNSATVSRIFGVIALFAFTAFLAIVFLQPNESSSSTSLDQGKTTLLDCIANTLEDSFFISKDASSYSHEVKLVYQNDRLTKVNYTYTGQFASDNEADSALSWLHADYNNYMGRTSIYQEELSPTFTAIDANAIINIFMDEEHFAPETAVFVFLDANEYSMVKKSKLDDAKNLYESKGFYCKNN